MNKLTIEIVVDDNIEQCRELCNELMKYQKSLAYIAQEQFDKMDFDSRLLISYQKTKIKQLIVLKDNNLPVGYVFSSIEDINTGDKSSIPDWAPINKDKPALGFYPDWLEQSKSIGCLNHLYIKKEYHSSGYGRKLLTMAMEWLESFKDIDYIFVYISNGNQNALDFYLNNGFSYSHDVFNGFIIALYKKL